jgi:hypothetical protein
MTIAASAIVVLQQKGSAEPPAGSCRYLQKTPICRWRPAEDPARSTQRLPRTALGDTRLSRAALRHPGHARSAVDIHPPGRLFSARNVWSGGCLRRVSAGFLQEKGKS